MRRKTNIKPQIQINFQGLIEYLKTHSRATLQALEIYFNALDVQDIMKKYNLTKEELRYRLHKNIPLDKIFYCKCCGKKIIYNIHNGYGECCSIKCANLLKNRSPEHKEKIKQTWLKRCGAVTNLITAEMKEHVRQLNMERYGTPSFSQTPLFVKKYRETSLKNCDETHHMKTKKSKEYFKSISKQSRAKAQETSRKRFGVDYYTTLLKGIPLSEEVKVLRNAKRKATCQILYNADTYVQSEAYQQKASEIREHREETIKRIYGVKSFSETKQFVEMCYKTHKENNTFNTSKPEQLVSKLLKAKFLDLKEQHVSDVYPFNCDFYIPSLDLYIECNFHWTHCPKLGYFNINNKEHIKRLSKWLKRFTKYYKRAINTWVVRDPLKRDTAIKNNLNYKVFWNIQEFYTWYDSLK